MTTDQYQFYYKDCRGRTPKYHESCGKWATLGDDNCWKDPCDDQGNQNNQWNQGLPNTKREEGDISAVDLYSRDDTSVMDKRCDSDACNADNSPWWNNASPGYIDYPTGHCKHHCDVNDIHRIPDDQCQQVHYKHHFKLYLKVKAFCYIKDTQRSDDCARQHGGVPYDFNTLQLDEPSSSC